MFMTKADKIDPLLVDGGISGPVAAQMELLSKGGRPTRPTQLRKTEEVIVERLAGPFSILIICIITQ